MYRSKGLVCKRGLCETGLNNNAERKTEGGLGQVVYPSSNLPFASPYAIFANRLTLKTFVRATLQMHWSLIFRTYLLSLVSFLSPRIP